jgi:hypothetical protein
LSDFIFRNLKKCRAVPLGDILICVAASLSCSFYFFEKETSATLVALITGLAYAVFFGSWLFTAFKGAVLKKYFMLPFAFVYWFLLPVIAQIIEATTKNVTGSDPKKFFSESLKLFCVYPLTNISKGKGSLNYILVGFIFFIVIAVVVLYGRKSRIGFERETLTAGVVFKATRKVIQDEERLCVLKQSTADDVAVVTELAETDKPRGVTDREAYSLSFNVVDDLKKMETVAQTAEVSGETKAEEKPDTAVSSK